MNTTPSRVVFFSRTFGFSFRTAPLNTASGDSSSAFKKAGHFSCCPTELVLLDEVAVAGAVAGRDGDCGDTFDVPMMSYGEATIDGLGDGHVFQKVAQLFKCYVLHVFV